MPEISRFFGIVIRMFIEAGGSHHLPHLHAYYQEHVGIYGIDPIELIAGSLPKRQERLVHVHPDVLVEEPICPNQYRNGQKSRNEGG